MLLANLLALPNWLPGDWQFDLISTNEAHWVWQLDTSIEPDWQRLKQVAECDHQLQAKQLWLCEKSPWLISFIPGDRGWWLTKQRQLAVEKQRLLHFSGTRISAYHENGLRHQILLIPTPVAAVSKSIRLRYGQRISRHVELQKGYQHFVMNHPTMYLMLAELAGQSLLIAMEGS